ncbi:MAG: trypsin-like serine protease [Deltaproteobacteria bacterium]|nr:trypsin-like serine protease [Deltaproteobacteria bacterium]
MSGRPWPCGLCLLALAACGSEGGGLARARQPIIDGVPDTDPAHMAVVAIYDQRALCSGTLITSRVVMTAGHCLYGRDGTRFEVFFGHTTQEAERRGVSAARLHPDYDPHGLTNDIALLRLAEGPPEGVAPIAALPASLALGEADLGGPLVFSGFGIDERGHFSEKLTVTGVLGKICATQTSCSGLGVPAAAGTICYDQELGGPCFGDSGGPAFVKRGGVEYAAGVTSYGDWRCDIYGCSTKVDVFEDFIAGFVDASKGLGAACQDGAECCSGFCTDGVCCDYACDRACEFCAQEGSEGHCRRVTDDSLEPGCSPPGGCASAPLPASRGGLGLALAMLSTLLAAACLRGRSRASRHGPSPASRRAAARCPGAVPRTVPRDLESALRPPRREGRSAIRAAVASSAADRRPRRG